MLSAHDAADSRLHHGNDCGDVAAVLLSLCSRRERSDNPEIRLRRSNVSACGSGETIDNPEIRLRRSNVSACGSGETIDNPEIRLRRSNVSAWGSGLVCSPPPRRNSQEASDVPRQPHGHPQEDVPRRHLIGLPDDPGPDDWRRRCRQRRAVYLVG